jgi:hypothetical protein
MGVEKQAQFNLADDREEKLEPGTELVVLEFDDDQDEDDLVFMLPDVPGAPDAEEIEINEDGDIEVGEEDDKDVEVEHDPWNWASRGMGNFLNWLKEMVDGVPRHSGYDTTGLEKAIAYFEALDKEITKAMRQDYRNEIDAAKAERAREQIETGLERLVDRLEKVKSTKYKRHAKKKKSWAENVGLIKEAQKATNITGITITVPLLISRIARVCINGMVSAGHDLEDLFASQVKEYNLDKREQAELSQLLADMGYTVWQDRGVQVGKPVDITQSDNKDWVANYPG